MYLEIYMLQIENVERCVAILDRASYEVMWGKCEDGCWARNEEVVTCG